MIYKALKSNQIDIRPTLLLSPYSLQILDTLFRLKKNQLRDFSSVLSFCKLHNIVQPKISLLMTTLRVSTLVDLRDRIAQLPLAWWQMAFSYPATKRHLTPFWNTFESYLSLNDAQLADMLKHQPTAAGPLAVAQKFGVLRSTVSSIWVEADFVQKFKKEFRLVPAASDFQSNQVFWVATCVRGFEREAIKSNSPGIINGHGLTSFGSNNSFRTLYDLSYFDERSREARDIMLKEILNGN